MENINLDLTKIKIDSKVIDSVGSFLNTDEIKNYCNKNHSKVKCNCDEVISFVDLNYRGGE
jgi:hypothetical protein